MLDILWNIQNSAFGEFLRVLNTLVAIVFVILIATVTHIKLSIKAIDAKVKKKYKEHFIVPASPNVPAVSTDEIPVPVEIVPPGRERWNKVEALFASPSESDWRVAIIEADSMLDEFVTSLGYPGANLGERLKNTNPQFFPTIQLAWDAHKIRNEIAHAGMDYRLSERTKEIARKNFQYIFTDAKYI